MSVHQISATSTSPVKTISSPITTTSMTTITSISTSTPTLTSTPTPTTALSSTSAPTPTFAPTHEPSLVRKRGRPKGSTKGRKPKSILGTGRGRGRPPGSTAMKVKSGRGRGRPKLTTTVKKVTTPGRGRGRPRTTPHPTTTTPHAIPTSKSTSTSEYTPALISSTTARKPGRPRTHTSTMPVNARTHTQPNSSNGSLSSSSPKKRRKYNAPHKIPTISRRQLSGSQWRQEYSKIHAVFVKDVCDVHTNPWTQQPRSKIKHLLNRFPDMVKTTFNLEHSRGTNPISDASPWPDMVEGQNRAWYASFVVQNDDEAVDEVLSALPTPSLAKGSEAENNLTHLKCAWLFFGENTDNAGVLQGRTEHTDAVNHDGTWHVQLSGTKTWFIRPTDELVKLSETSLSSDVVFEITCGPGDLLLLNTRLWWHRTEITDTSFANDQLSCSYARDIVFGDAEEACDMTNVDGLFAKDFIGKGTIVLRASDNPDLELPSNDNPTCEVSETDDGAIVLIAARDIAKGEWFSVDIEEEEDGANDDTDDDDNVNDDDNAAVDDDDDGMVGTEDAMNDDDDDDDDDGDDDDDTDDDDGAHFR